MPLKTHTLPKVIPGVRVSIIMALADDYIADPDTFRKKRVDQIIRFAGEGKLLDGSQASIEFRELLSTVDTDLLRTYCSNCIDEKFDDCGLALQDIVNEMAIRLGFEVEHGKYRNCPFDGLWTSPEGRVIVVEVKKVSEFAQGLQKVESARLKLIEQGKAKADNSSGLMVVGKGETEFLEAQIRGSRFAWEMRLISVEALTRLLILKEEFDDPTSAKRVRRILSPEEYTKLDPIIELLLGSIMDVSEDTESLLGLGDSSEPQSLDNNSEEKPKKRISSEINKFAADRISSYLEINFRKNSRVSYLSSDSVTCFTIMASKLHKSREYWYGFRKHHNNLLSDYSNSFAAFACGDQNKVLLIPHSKFSTLLDGMNMTFDQGNDERSYWHVHIHEIDGKFILYRKKSTDRIDVTEYLI